MISLNKKATKLFLRFLAKMEDKDELEIPIKDKSSLLLKKGEEVRGETWSGYLFSIGLLQPGREEKYEFKMEFIVVEQPAEIDRKATLPVYPASTFDEENNVQAECVRILLNVVVGSKPAWQKAQANLAYTWLSELKAEGYIK